MSRLSDRIRANSEAAPWVVEEVVKLEVEVERLTAESEALRRARPRTSVRHDRVLDVQMFGFSFGLTAAELDDLPRDGLLDWLTEKFRDSARAALPGGETK